MRLPLDKEEALWQQRQQLYSQIPDQSRKEVVKLLAQLVARAVRPTSSSEESERSREDQ
jgi:predicted Fe-S protein YdhL (DUF1289 family)